MSGVRPEAEALRNHGGRAALVPGGGSMSGVRPAAEACVTTEAVRHPCPEVTA